MKNPINKLFVLLAIVMSFVVVQSVSAAEEHAGGKFCNVIVYGEVTDINKANNTIVVEGATTVWGIPFQYLENQIPAIVPGTGDDVVIDAIQCPCDSKIEACTLSVNDSDNLLPSARSPQYPTP
ncbi:MAG: hypothetical protein OEM01_02305 [Desulfobulbaceae bacterium]|nr:hypothetical protein [Desulfobulbaceae bacterium]